MMKKVNKNNVVSVINHFRKRIINQIVANIMMEDRYTSYLRKKILI